MLDLQKAAQACVQVSWFHIGLTRGALVHDMKRKQIYINIHDLGFPECFSMNMFNIGSIDRYTNIVHVEYCNISQPVQCEPGKQWSMQPADKEDQPYWVLRQVPWQCGKGLGCRP